ncbi:MAG: 2Fe-2S iron-sulfur cluster-binding protein [Gammaproteobacteria bacterium]|nr:2Fe-2S iron-sulfur cluster-binding protein [Gammaproteobacteria bacterium]MDH5727915.1 2Fe-2S iron-sulfur cluster-binding protein [Gammaproteobacteria bacterium]
MSYQVTFLPQGKQVECSAHESLLEASLRCGINTAYSCANGSCGDCKARLLMGSTQAIQHTDFRFKESEKNQDWFLLCSYAPTSDCTIEIQETNSAETIPQQEIQLKFSKLKIVENRIAILTARAPRSKTLRFLAGQFVDLFFEDFDAIRVPVASCPCNGMIIEFHLDVLSKHPAVTALISSIVSGQSIKLRGPFGAYHINENPERDLLFIAVDNGFAPIRSMLEHVLALELPHKIQLIWIASENYPHYYDNICRSWADAFDQLSYQALYTQAVDDLQKSCKQLFKQALVDFAATDIYLAATADNINCIQAALSYKNIQAGQVLITQVSE